MRVTALGLLILLGAACATTPDSESCPMIEAVQAGEFWYRLQDENGQPQGYARLHLGKPEDGGLIVAWELKIAFSGGTYEETRGLALGSEGELVAASYLVSEVPISEAKRSGDRLKGFAMEGEEKSPVDLKLPDDAITGMLFVLCPGVPLEDGGKLAFQELDEARGFAPLGKTELVYAGPEEVEGKPAHRIDIEKKKGGMPVWVTEDGRILKSDWGGGNVMVLSETSTKHLFDPKPPAVMEMPGEPDRLVVEGVFPKFTAAEMYEHFTQSELITKWWAEKATVDVNPGGAYVLEWPNAKWTLRGEVKEAEPGKLLVFTWAWDHMPEAPTRTVTVEFIPEGEGTRLRVTHAAYGEGEAEAKERQGHLAGWSAVLSRLRDLK